MSDPPTQCADLVYILGKSNKHKIDKSMGYPIIYTIFYICIVNKKIYISSIC